MSSANRDNLTISLPICIPFLFVETIAASISLCVIDLFRWLINILLVQFWILISNDWKFVHFFKIFQFIKIQVLKVVSDDSLDFLGACCYVPFFISDFTNLGLFPSSF
jgi:hypothetical protein